MKCYNVWYRKGSTYFSLVKEWCRTVLLGRGRVTISLVRLKICNAVWGLGIANHSEVWLMHRMIEHSEVLLKNRIERLCTVNQC